MQRNWNIDGTMARERMARNKKTVKTQINFFSNSDRVHLEWHFKLRSSHLISTSNLCAAFSALRVWRSFRLCFDYFGFSLILKVIQYRAGKHHMGRRKSRNVGIFQLTRDAQPPEKTRERSDSRQYLCISYGYIRLTNCTMCAIRYFELLRWYIFKPLTIITKHSTFNNVESWVLN